MDRIRTMEDTVGRSEDAGPPMEIALLAIGRFWHRTDRRPFIPGPVRAHNDVSYAVVNHGRWIVRCPFCAGAQLACRTDRRFFCVDCLNETAGGAFLAVVWPEDEKEIERSLLLRPSEHTRNWERTETASSLRAENAREMGVR